MEQQHCGDLAKKQGAQLQPDSSSLGSAFLCFEHERDVHLVLWAKKMGKRVELAHPSNTPSEEASSSSTQRQLFESARTGSSGNFPNPWISEI